MKNSKRRGPISKKSGADMLRPPYTLRWRPLKGNGCHLGRSSYPPRVAASGACASVRSDVCTLPGTSPRRWKAVLTAEGAGVWMCVLGSQLCCSAPSKIGNGQNQPCFGRLLRDWGAAELARDLTCNLLKRAYKANEGLPASTATCRSIHFDFRFSRASSRACKRSKALPRPCSPPHADVDCTPAKWLCSSVRRLQPADRAHGCEPMDGDAPFSCSTKTAA